MSEEKGLPGSIKEVKGLPREGMGLLNTVCLVPMMNPSRPLPGTEPQPE